MNVLESTVVQLTDKENSVLAEVMAEAIVNYSLGKEDLLQPVEVGFVTTTLSGKSAVYSLEEKLLIKISSDTVTLTGVGRIRGEYSYDANGRIHCSAKEMTGNKKAGTEIHRDSGLDDYGLNAFQNLAKEYQVE